MGMDEENRSTDKRTTLDNLEREKPCSLVLVKKEDALCNQEEVKSTEVQVKEENPLKPVEKAIQEMAKHLKKDPQSLLFCLEQGGGKLTGKEMMGDLEGARIVVTRLS